MTPILINIDRNKPFYVGDWRVDAKANQICQENIVTTLEPKVMDVLVYLAQRAGQVIDRQELENQIWAGMVVGYDSLTRSITKLRKSFDDHPQEPRIVQTVSKRGYRLIAPVELIDSKIQNEELAIEFPRTATGNHPILRWRILVGIIALVVIGLFIYRWQYAYLTDKAIIPIQHLSGKVAIVVLPFRNESNDPAQEYFSDGLTEDLITDMSAISSLFVISHATSIAYKGRGLDARSIGRELSVNYVVEGSVRKSGNRIRVTTTLSNVSTGYQIWAKRYDLQVKDVFSLQDEIIKNLITSLKLELSSEENLRVMRRYTNSVEAYDLFLQGLSDVAAYNANKNQQAREKFESAIKLDPDFARAYSALANTYRLDSVQGWSETRKVSLDTAEKLALQALTMNNQLPQVQFILGTIARDKKMHEQAIAYAERAIALDPNYADAYVLLGSSLCYTGQSLQGIKMIREGASLNPIQTSNYSFYTGVCHFTAGDFTAAISAIKSAISINPSSIRYRAWLAASYALAGQNDEAHWEIDELKNLNPDFSVRNFIESAPYNDQGNMQRLLDGLNKAGLVLEH